jgi:hypothetical protein
MTAKEKKQLILAKLENGDKRSYNEIQADLELEIWTARYKSIDDIKVLKSL